MSLLEKIDSVGDLKKIPQDQLPELARELRQYILEVVSTSGGHIASALGAVELAVAIHYFFNSPQDTIVWDVGHQAHAHKILTGRREAFKTFRQHGGLSGFCNKDESPHDAFTTGHAGASISTALGVAVSNRLLAQKDRKVVAVVGDASLANGMAFEALNHAGHLKDNLIVVLNDNEMSISQTVGAFSNYLNRIISNPIYNHLRKDVEKILKKIPKVGERVAAKARKLDEGLRNVLVPGMLFEELGFRYFGPVDGHNIGLLTQIFKNVSQMKGPVLLHVITQKGKGYKIAESDPAHWHASMPFCIQTGRAKSSAESLTYTQAFGSALCRLARKDPRVVAVTAAMCEGTGLVEFAREFPNRFFDVGIAEEHAVSFAAGLARSGFRPFVAVYSTFLQRGFDQIIHDVALQGLPVIFAVDRAGLVGEDGPTHHGAFDISYLRQVPGMCLMAPKDGAELSQMMAFALSADKGPVAIRFPRAAVWHQVPGNSIRLQGPAIEEARAEVMTRGSDVLLVAYGSMVECAWDAAELLRKESLGVTVINARFAKPLDEKTILEHAKGKQLTVTLEEGTLCGGFGGAVLELFANKVYKKSDRPLVKTLGLPDCFVTHGRREFLLELVGLTPEAVRNCVIAHLNPARALSVAGAAKTASPAHGRAGYSKILDKVAS